MRKDDILIIFVVAIVAGIFSYIIAGFVFGGEQKYDLQSPEVQPISSEFKQPNEKYFNSDSLDITKDITVTNNDNTDPFKSSN